MKPELSPDIVEVSNADDAPNHLRWEASYRSLQHDNAWRLVRNSVRNAAYLAAQKICEQEKFYRIKEEPTGTFHVRTDIVIMTEDEMRAFAERKFNEGMQYALRRTSPNFPEIVK